MRKRILQRDDYRCLIQLTGCTGLATQVHHKLGRAITGDTMPEFLVSSCAHCNQVLGEPKTDGTQPTYVTEW